jgi:hypothetical protein
MKENGNAEATARPRGEVEWRGSRHLANKSQTFTCQPSGNRVSKLDPGVIAFLNRYRKTADSSARHPALALAITTRPCLPLSFILVASKLILLHSTSTTDSIVTSEASLPRQVSHYHMLPLPLEEHWRLPPATCHLLLPTSLRFPPRAHLSPSSLHTHCQIPCTHFSFTKTSAHRVTDHLLRQQIYAPRNGRYGRRNHQRRHARIIHHLCKYPQDYQHEPSPSRLS